MYRYIECFKKGAEVPSWMMSIEPDNPNSAKGTLRFGFDCHVVETNLGYMVINDGLTVPETLFIIPEGGVHASISASSRSVYMATSFMMFEGPDDKGQSDEPVVPTTPADAPLWG